MKRTIFATLTIVLTFFTIMGIAQENVEPILKFMPAEMTCCVRFRSLSDLSDKAGELLNELAIPDMPPVNLLLLQLFGQILDVQLTDIKELEDFGLDAVSSGAIFWIEPTFQKILMAVHIKERPLVEESLLPKFGELFDVEYNGVSYLKGDAGAFVFFDDVLLYAQDEADGKRCIDAKLGKQPSILSVPDDASHLSLRGNENDVVGFISLHRLAETYSPLLKTKLEEGKSEIQDDIKREAPSQPGVAALASLLTAGMDLGLWVFEQAQSFSASLAFDTRRVQLDTSMRFKSQSEIQNLLSFKPRALSLFSALPHNTPMAGSIAVDAGGIERVVAALLDGLIASNQRIEATDVQAQRQEFLETIRDFLKLLGDEGAFTIEGFVAGPTGAAALLVTTFLMPFATPFGQDATYVFEVSDERAVSDYFADFVSKMDAISAMFIALGVPDDVGTPFVGLQKGDAEEYNGTHIESIHIPNYPAFPLPFPGRMSSPQKFSLRYALKSGKLVLSLSRDAKGIKNVLDVLGGKMASFAEAEGFQNVFAALPSECNSAYYISPVGYFKSIMEFASQMGESIPPAQRQVVDALVGGVAIGNSTVLQDGKVKGRMHVSVDEVKNLIAGISKLTESDRAGQRVRNQMRQYRESGDLDKMLELVQEIVNSNPRDISNVQYELIRAFADYNRLDELETYFQNEVDKNPTEPSFYKMLGEIYRRQQDNAKAIEMYEKATTLDKNDVRAYSQLGRIYQEQGMTQKAISAFEKALELQPRYTSLFPELARAYVSAGQKEEALKLAEKLKGQVGNNAYSYARLGDVYAAAEAHDEAIKAYEKAVELRPEERYFKEKLAGAYEKAGKDDLAAELRESLSQPPRVVNGLSPVHRRDARRKAPGLLMQTLDGKTIKLSDFRGKVVILNFWATWAPACIKEMVALEELAKSHKDDLMVIGMSVDTDGSDGVKVYVEKRKITYPIIIATREMLDEYEIAIEEPIETIPTTIIVDKSGYIKSKYAGAQSKDALEKAYQSATVPRR